MVHYKAHWDTLLIVVSSLLTVLCLDIAFGAFKRGGLHSGWDVVAGDRGMLRSLHCSWLYGHAGRHAIEYSRFWQWGLLLVIRFLLQ